MFQMKQMKAARRCLPGAVLLLAAGWAHGACYVTVGTLAFGAYQAAQATNLDATVNVTYNCDSNGRFSYAFSAGASGNSNARTMTNGIDTLGYQLYADANRTQVLTGGSDNGGKSGLTVTYYGRIAANQDVTPGAYSDSIILTVTP